MQQGASEDFRMTAPQDRLRAAAQKVLDTTNDAAWIALLGPNNAPALAEILEEAAEAINDDVSLFGHPRAWQKAALVFADNILGADT